MSLIVFMNLSMWRVRRSTLWTAAWRTTCPTLLSCGLSAPSTSSSPLTFLHGPVTPALRSRSSSGHLLLKITPCKGRIAEDIFAHFFFKLSPQELLLAEKWARMNKLPFPKIDPKVFDREGLKECYVFKPRKGEKNCPTVIHFVLVNINFRTFKAPGEYADMWRFHGHVWAGKNAPLKVCCNDVLASKAHEASLPWNCALEFKQIWSAQSWASHLGDPSKNVWAQGLCGFVCGGEWCVFQRTRSLLSMSVWAHVYIRSAVFHELLR